MIAVPADNPADISTLEDLARPGIEVDLGDVKACAIGHLGKKILLKNGIYEQVHKNTVVYGPTVNQLLLYVATGKSELVQKHPNIFIILYYTLLGRCHWVPVFRPLTL